MVLKITFKIPYLQQYPKVGGEQLAETTELLVAT